MEMTAKESYNTTKDSKFTGLVDRTFNPPRLIARGFILDVVDGLAFAQKYDDGEIPPTPIPSKPLSQSSAKGIIYSSAEETKEAIWRAMVAGRDGLGNIAPESYETVLQVISLESSELAKAASISDNISFKIWLSIILATQKLELGGRELGVWLRAFSQEDETFEFPDMNVVVEALTRAWSVSLDRRFMTTGGGAFGLASRNAEAGDVICLLLACSFPVIPRQDTGTGTYQVVGEAFIHGVMDGELMGDGTEGFEDFIIV